MKDRTNGNDDSTDAPSASRSILAVVLVTAALGLVTACQESSTPDPDATDGPRNVLIVSFDTTRADVLGCYGGDKGCSTAIDANCTA